MKINVIRSLDLNMIFILLFDKENIINASHYLKNTEVKGHN